MNKDKILKLKAVINDRATSESEKDVAKITIDCKRAC
jgi:hypothetical protein